MSFLDIALPLAAKGFRVFPLIPRDKAPLPMSEGDHFDAATTERSQIEPWASVRMRFFASWRLMTMPH